MRAPVSVKHGHHFGIGEIERGGESRGFRLVGRCRRRARCIVVEPDDAVANRVLGHADRTAKRAVDDVAAFGAVDRSHEPRLIVRSGASKHVDERNEHSLIFCQLWDRRSSSMLTSAGCVAAKSTARATASGRSMVARGLKPGRLSGSIGSQSEVSTGPGETSVARTPLFATSARSTSCRPRRPNFPAAYAAFSGNATRSAIEPIVTMWP